nr:ribosomal protein S3AE [uncultured bacterium]
MCRKTRQSIPASIRRGLEKNPEIAYRLLDAHDLFRDA